MLFDIGFSEILLFSVVALIVLGPEKLPQTARSVGRWYGKFRRTVAKIQSEMEAELDFAETRQKMQEELAKIKQAELAMKQEMDALKSSFQALQQNHSSQSTQPMYHQWFLLSEYDRKKRLPNPPFLPNYQADKLLS